MSVNSARMVRDGHVRRERTWISEWGKGKGYLSSRRACLDGDKPRRSFILCQSAGYKQHSPWQWADATARELLKERLRPVRARCLWLVMFPKLLQCFFQLLFRSALPVGVGRFLQRFQ